MGRSNSDDRSGKHNISFFFVNLRTFQYKIYYYFDIYYHSYEHYQIRARTHIFLRDTKDYQNLLHSFGNTIKGI